MNSARKFSCFIYCNLLISKQYFYIRHYGHYHIIKRDDFALIIVQKVYILLIKKLKIKKLKMHIIKI